MSSFSLTRFVTIYRKEIMELLRDRRTVIFAVIVPILVIPLLMMGLGRLIQTLEAQQRLQVVRVLADEQTRTQYEQLVFEWFQNSPVGLGMAVAESPLAAGLKNSSLGEAFDAIPQGVTQDINVFREWTNTLRKPDPAQKEKARELLAEQDLSDIQKDYREAALDFHDVVIKGYALVDWVSPETLSVPEVVIASAEPELFPYDHRGRLGVSQQLVEAVIHLPSGIGEKLLEPRTTTEVTILHDSTISLSREANSRLEQVYRKVAENAAAQRLQGKDLPSAFLRPLRVSLEGNIASRTRITSEFLGSILPYLVIIFSFLGGLFPALDLGAGEKERQTLETLLLSTASRLEIALGKYFVIFSSSLLAALLGVTSMVLSYQILMPTEIRTLMEFELSTTQILACSLLLFPTAAMFSGLFLALSIYARSFKEAQNTIAPFQFLLILPALAPILPTVRLNATLALVPLVNVSLLTKEFLKGDIRWDYYGLTVGSCSLLAAICIAYCIRQFHREEVLFRS
ncbi:MAG: ABC transporter permease subunit [Candidatus Sumerlaeia bacterium]|nr:ABC transporter permease subunit [Candidatus Sumerlaeia bacterium]